MAVGPVVAVLWSGCIDSTCSTDADCAKSEYCPLAVGACLLPTPIPSACKPRPEGCTSAVLEVCGCDGETHESACVAAQAGTAVAFEGPCEEQPEPEPVVGCGASCGDGEYCELPTGACVLGTAEGSCQPIPEGCIDEVKSPVCGCDGIEYDSPCHAAMAQVQVFAEGSCACTTSPDSCPNGTFCELGVGGCFDSAPTGVCRSIPTTCPVAYVPVCGCDGDDYENACVAAQAGTSVAFEGVCEEPVVGCGAGCGAGNYCELPLGACVLGTAEGSCQPVPEGCIDEVKSLVCGCDGLEYDSPCHAAMAQVQVFAEGSCACTTTPDSCPNGTFCQLGVGGCFDAEATGVCKTIPTTCPIAYVPVCGCNGEDYDNACDAAAEGQNVAALGDCELPTDPPPGP